LCSPGEFGSVYEGVFTQDDGVDLKVAVKTMRGTCLDSEPMSKALRRDFLLVLYLMFSPSHVVGIHSQEDLHEFLREAEIMKNFDHEHVVRLLGEMTTLTSRSSPTQPEP